MMLVAIQTHPVQYHAPVFRAVQQECGVPVTALYGSDFSLRGYRDVEFGATFAWDTDLLSGYRAEFLRRVDDGGAREFSQVSADGLGKRLEQLSPTAVLVGGYSPRFHRVAFFEAWRRRLPILFRAETSDVDSTSGITRTAKRIGLRALYSQTARCLYIGERSRRHYESLGYAADHLVFSPYCVDDTSFAADEDARLRLRAPARRRIGATDEHLVVLFSGKLTPKKRPDLMLEALPRVSAALQRPIVALFVGDGELRPALEARASQLSGVTAHFGGFTPQRQLSAYYHAADVLVLPSQHSETWGLVVNEALLHGLPCTVSSAVGCAEDLVQPGLTGETFHVGSSDALESALLRLAPRIGEPAVRTACRHIVSRYSVRSAAAGIASAYRSLASDVRH